MKNLKILSFLFLLSFFYSCQNQEKMDQARQLGVVSAFSELVNSGVKKLALSSTMSTEEMDQFLPLAQALRRHRSAPMFRPGSELFTRQITRVTLIKIIALNWHSWVTPN